MATALARKWTLQSTREIASRLPRATANVFNGKVGFSTTGRTTTGFSLTACQSLSITSHVECTSRHHEQSLASSHHATSVRSFSGRSRQGYDTDVTPRAVKVDARQRSSVIHQKKVEENKKKRDKLKAALSGKKSDDDDDNDEEDDDDDDREADSDDEAGNDGDTGPTLPDPKKVKERMLKVVAAMEKSMLALRGAEPSPELLESIRVQVYGEFMALGSVAQVVIVSPTLAHVSCFDPSTVKDVRAALTESALDLNPHVDENDGTTLVVPLPRLSLETRQKMVQQLQRQAEASRLKIRRIRQKAIDVCNKGKQGKLEHIGKDDAFRISKDVEAATQDAVAKLNAKVEQKSKSVLQV